MADIISFFETGFANVGQFFERWFAKLYETFIATNMYTMIFDGLRNTLIITLGALAIGVLIGTVIAVVKYFAEDVRALRPLAAICNVYVTVIRGIPMTVLLLIFYYIIMKAAKDGVPVAIVAFGVNSGAYMAELIRSGLNAVDVGQMEAGRRLGLSKLQTMRKIIMPQAVRYILPAIGNEMIALLKETSVAGYVAIVDLTRALNLIRNNTFDAINTLGLCALIYLALTMLLTGLLGRMERRMAGND